MKLYFKKGCENMQKFRKKIWIELMLKSLAIGLSVGIIITSIVLIICKLNGIHLLAFYYVLISMVSAVVLGGLFFWIKKPDRMQLAKRLDQQLELNQKVETMVAFEAENAMMLQLQREDTQERLNHIPVQRLKMKFHWSIILVPILALAFLIPSLVIPMEANAVDEPPVVDPDYAIDDKTIQAILAMIEEIKSREQLEATVREAYILELQELITGLSAENLHESDKNALVLVTIQKALDTCNNYVSYREVSSVLQNSENSNIRKIGAMLEKNKAEDVLNEFEYVRVAMQASETAELEKLLAEIRRDIGEALQNAELDVDKNISKAFIQFSDLMAGCSGETELKKKVMTAYSVALIEMEQALDREELTSDTYEYINTQLRAIFNLKEENPEQQDPNEQPEDPEDPKKEDDPANQGGAGTGDTIYAGDDQFFDPEKGLVKYGDVISDYNSVITAMIMEGSIPPEMEEYFKAYFALLYGNNQENSEKEE